MKRIVITSDGTWNSPEGDFPTHVLRLSRAIAPVAEKNVRQVVFNDLNDLKQVWFSGVHCDVGGGYKEKGLADAAFEWMIREAQSQHLKIETHLLDSVQPDPTDKQHNEHKGLYKLRGKPEKRRIPPDSLIHHTVKIRYEKLQGKFRSPAFRDFFDEVDEDWSRVRVAV